MLEKRNRKSSSGSNHSDQSLGGPIVLRTRGVPAWRATDESGLDPRPVLRRLRHHHWSDFEFTWIGEFALDLGDAC